MNDAPSPEPFPLPAATPQERVERSFGAEMAAKDAEIARLRKIIAEHLNHTKGGKLVCECQQRK
jgi:hypothetical protein